MTFGRLNSPKTSCRGDMKKTCLEVLRLAIELDIEFVEIELEVSLSIPFSETRVVVNANHINKLYVLFIQTVIVPIS